MDYRAFKRGFQASRNQSQSLYMALIKLLHIPFLLNIINVIEEKLKNNFPIKFDYFFNCAKISIIPSMVICNEPNRVSLCFPGY